MTRPAPRPRRRTRLGLGLGLALAALVGAVFVARCRLDHPAASALLVDRHGGFLAQIGGHDGTGYGYWPLDRVPERIAAATLAIEDQRFWYHPGVDPLALGRAVRQNWRSGSRRSGASTIAMQVARLQDPGPRSYWRKALEATTAPLLVLRYGHDAVLRQYLTLAPYGQGSHGIAHAARWYFDKPLEDLSWAEIAFLTAIPQAPGLMNPGSPTGQARIRARGNRILVRLIERGVISPAEQRSASAALDAIRIAPRSRPSQSLHAILRIEALFAAGVLVPARADDAVLHATLDADLQREVAKQTSRALAAWRAEGAEQVAVLVADRATRQVLAAFGSRGYFQAAGAIDYTRRDRSPGSTLKPFIYALGLDQGVIAPDSLLADLPYNRAGIDNADHNFFGPMLPAEALANSRNVPATNLVRKIGIEPTYRLLRDLRLTKGERAAGHYGLVMAIGAVPTRLDRLVAAYGALANDGWLQDLTWVDGQPTPLATRVMSADAARQITLFLSNPLVRLPSFPRMGPTEYAFPVAVKTGTSQGYRDAWAVAYSRRYVVGVWVGRSNAGSMDGLSGGRTAARLVHDLLYTLHRPDASGIADVAFPAPAASAPSELCLDDGEATGCARRLVQYLVPKRTLEPPLAAAAEARVTIVSPDNQIRLIRNPETPATLNWIALRAKVEGATAQVLWWVDEQPFKLAAADEVVRWPLTPGVHRIRAELAARRERSSLVTIEVR
jgi:penicillin-binding protein 1C